MQKKEEEKAREQRGRGCGRVNNTYTGCMTRLFMTRLNASHCVDERETADRAAEMHGCTRKNPRDASLKATRLSTCYAKARTMASAKINYSPGLSAAGKERRRKRERKFFLLRRNADERAGAGDVSQKISPATTPGGGCCWRHDFAGRNFAHVLLRERLKRDEPWRWKMRFAISRFRDI